MKIEHKKNKFEKNDFQLKYNLVFINIIFKRKKNTLPIKSLEKKFLATHNT